MAQIAKVTSLTGKAFVVGADGSVRELKVGDTIQKGEVVRTAAGARAELTMLDGQKLVVAEEQTVRADDNLARGDATPSAADGAVATGTIDTVIQALERGGDLTEELEAAAAGGGAGDGGEGNAFVRLLRVAEGVDPLSFEFSTSTQSVPDVLEPGNSNGPLSTSMTLTADPLVTEAEGIKYTVMLGAPARSDMTITLSNGAVITIAAGQTTGSVTVPPQGDDTYQDGETVQVTVGSVTGGGYSTLVVNDQNVVTVIDDTIDTTHAVLTSEGGGDEDVGSVTYTVELDNAPQADQQFQLTLSNGQVVMLTVEAGATSGSVTVAWGVEIPPDAVALKGYPDSDVYAEEAFELSAEIVAVGNGGNFEALDVVNESSPVTIGDSFDTTTVTLGSVEYLEGTENATVTATLSSAPIDGPLVLTLSNGATITFDTDYVAGTPVTSTPFTVLVTEHGEPGSETDAAVTEPIAVLSYTGGEQFEALDFINGELTILDGQPRAVNDVDVVEQGVATGNVITGAGTLPTFAGNGDGPSPGPSHPVAGDDRPGFEGGRPPFGPKFPSFGVDKPGTDGGLHVVGVKAGSVEGQPGPDGTFTVQGQYGTLTIHADGNYIYTYNAQPGSLQDITMTPFQQGVSFLDAQGRYSNALAGGVVTDVGRDGYGVAGNAAISAPNEINYFDGKSEALAFQFGEQAVTSATVSVSRLYQNEKGGEAARWYAFDSEGNLVASGVVSANAEGPYANSTSVTWVNVHQATFTVSGIGAFSTLVFDAVPYSKDGHSTIDDSDFFVKVQSYEVAPSLDGDYTDVFTYTIEDADGDPSSATLTIHGNAISGEAQPTVAPVAVGNAYEVTENDTVAGNVITDDDDGRGAASGRDWDADTPVINLSVASLLVDGVAVAPEADGSYVVVTPYGTLTMQPDGSYSYVANGAATLALAEGALAQDVFHYTVKDPNGNVSNEAELVIKITGTNDVPVAVDDAVNLTEDVTLGTINGNVLDNDVPGADGPIQHVQWLWTPEVLDELSKYGNLTLDGGGVWRFDLHNDRPEVQALAEGETKSFSVGYVIQDADGDQSQATLTINITGTNDAPVAQAVTASGAEDSVGIPVTLQGHDIDGTVTGFVIGSLENLNGKLYLDGVELKEGDAVPADAAGEAVVTFVPTPDLSNSTPSATFTFEYQAQDNAGALSAPATATITVDPVTDVPTVELTLTPSTTTSLYGVDLSNVLNGSGGATGTPAGFTVTAYKDGALGEISIKDTGFPTGFGVAGAASNGADSEIGQGEKLVVELDTPATSVTFQLAWLNSHNETAVYTVRYTDGSSESHQIAGGHDGIEDPVTFTATVGKTIAAIEFSTPADGARVATSDYLLHTVSYESATTNYTVDITATPTDVDHSESIAQLLVKTPAGTALSGAENLGTVDGVTTWKIALDGSGGFTNTVAIDPDTGVVTVKGLTLSVPAEITELTVTATAEARDGSSGTASAADSVTVLMGTAGSDVLTGGDSSDILIGGAGNDTLTGGAGADVFKWSLGDQGSADSPAVDHITDFSKAEGDTLDLRDLLQGESADTLTHFLSFGEEGGKAVLSVSTTADGDVTQKIVFDNMSLVQLENTFGATSADDLIAKMKSAGNLDTH